MDGNCPSDFFFLNMDGAGEDGLSAIGDGISSPFPAVALDDGYEQVAVQNHFYPMSRQYYKTSDYLSSQHPKNEIL